MKRPDAQASAGRRRRAALAGHQQKPEEARRLLADPVPAVRATALAALARAGQLAREDLAGALGDPSPVVRSRACEMVAARGPEEGLDLRPLLADEDAGVVEMAAWAAGELGAAASGYVTELAGLATTHADPLCREAAVAALGAVGDRRGLAAILTATSDRPAVRRRAVIALAPFDGPDVDEALRRAKDDRDWQVRQAAEDLTDEA
ncbi:MAG: HEAT repeat domain-containing protein [Acidimicrobiales bacterium]